MGNNKARKDRNRAFRAKNPIQTDFDADRTQGVQVYRPFVFGSIAELLPPSDDPKRDPKLPVDHTHRWTVYVRGVDGADITHWLKKVSFKLHESFAQATRTLEAPDLFEVTETGWGEFEIAIRLYFVPEANEKPTPIYHFLKLHPYGENAEETKAKRLPVKSETYTEIVFVEPFEPFFDILTGGGPVSRGGKGGKSAKAKKSREDEEKARTAEIPTTSSKNNPFSRTTEETELKQLAEAQEKVQLMVQEQLKANAEKDAELKRLREQLDLPVKGR